MEGLFAEWVGLAGFAALIALLINIGKAAGWVKDGQAPIVSAALNLLGLAGLLAAKVFAPDIDLAGVDAQVSDFVQVGVVVTTYVLQLLASKGANAAIKGVPVVGYSHTERG